MLAKLTGRKGPPEDEKLAVLIATSLSLQEATAGARGEKDKTTPSSPLSTPKVEVRKQEGDQERLGSSPSTSSSWQEKEKYDSFGKDESDNAPPLPENSMKVGCKTPDGVLITAELKSAWKRCIEEGRITDIEAKEMSYCDLVALLGPCRLVLLSKRQVEEIHDDANITGKIVIVHEGFIWYLMHKIKKLRHYLWMAHRHIRELEEKVHRNEVEISRLLATVVGLEQIVKHLEEEIRTLTTENERLTKSVDELSKTVRDLQKQVNKLQNENVLLQREIQYWKDKAEEEKKAAERYKKLWLRCSRDLRETRDVYDKRRNEIVDILMKPLPSPCCIDEDLTDNEVEEKKKD